jgi:hypothetical protein
VGRQATAADSHSQTCLQTFFSLYLWWENNRTTPACWKTYWNCIAFELGTLGGLFFFWCSFILLYVFPLMRQLQSNIWGIICKTVAWGTNTKILKTETLLHLNLEVFIFYFVLFYIYTFFSFIYLFFIFILIFTLFIFYFQSFLCLSNAFSAYGWLVHCLSLFISLKLFLFVALFCFFSTWLFVFPFSFNFFVFHPLSPFHSKYH